jgi:AP2-associated kinase
MKSFTEKKVKTTKHEGDIPVEELMNMQKKIQQSQKRKNKNDDFQEWSEAKYPEMQNKQDNNDWSQFAESKQASNNQGFDDFGDFGSGDNAKETNQQWGQFDFGDSKQTTEQASSNEGGVWSFGHWETPQVNPEREKNENNYEEQGQANKEDKHDNFDLL